MISHSPFFSAPSPSHSIKKNKKQPNNLPHSHIGLKEKKMPKESLSSSRQHQPKGMPIGWHVWMGLFLLISHSLGDVLVLKEGDVLEHMACILGVEVVRPLIVPRHYLVTPANTSCPMDRRRTDRLIQPMITKHEKRDFSVKAGGLIHIARRVDKRGGNWVPEMLGDDPMLPPPGTQILIVDDGMWPHPDLVGEGSGFNPKDSYNANQLNWDVTPSQGDDHGTRCAGEIAGLGRHCQPGLLPGNPFAVFKLLGGPTDDALESLAFSHEWNTNGITSNSWGPPDDGMAMAGPHELALAAIEASMDSGRDGLGTIHIFASGNGGELDHCAMDGYVSSPMVIAVGAVDANGHPATYQERCPSRLISMPSWSGRPRDPWVSTVSSRSLCTDTHGGTSAAAPLAAALVSAILAVNPRLGWVDVQWILAASTGNVPGGHDLMIGFGIPTFPSSLALAQLWDPMDWKIVQGTKLERVDGSVCGRIVVLVEFSTGRRGNLELSLVSPSGQKAELLGKRPLDKVGGTFRWNFGTVAFMGTDPTGTWTIRIKGGTLVRWTMETMLVSLGSNPISPP